MMLLLCVDALFSRYGGVAEYRWNLPWTREVCSRDPEEAWMMDCKAMATPMASNLKLLSDALSESVDATMYRQMIGVIDVPNEHETRHLLCYEHLESVLDRSEKCSLDCCKAYSEVPEGYN